MAKISMPDHRMVWIDPETGRLTPDGFRKLKELIDRLNTLLS